jgi:putative hydroxymethylpyrimidine transport system substrate-binding protein
LKLLQSGRADLVISYEPELLLARDKGADLVSVGALVQKPLTTLMSLKDIERPEDLAGKRVGTAGLPYQSAYLKTILTKAGVDPETVKETNVGFNLVPAMLSDKVDATLGAFWNYEGEDLKRRGRHPKILRMEKLGVPTYDELVMVVRRKDLDEGFSSKLRRFLRATARGHQRLRANPESGVAALLKVDPGLERGLQTAVVSATLPVFFPTDKDKPFGYQESSEWDAYGRWMFDSQLLKKQPDAARALTNEFLPGEGLNPRTNDAP